MRIGNRGHDGFFVGSGSGIERSQAAGVWAVPLEGEPLQGKEAAAGAAVEVAAEVASVEVAADVELAAGASAGVVSSSSGAVGSMMPASLSASMAGRVRSWRLLMKARTAARRGER